MKGKGQLMTYYLIGKGGTSPSNPETIFKGDEETKNNPDSVLGLDEDIKINLEINENSSDNPVHNKITERVLTQQNAEDKLVSTEGSEKQNTEHKLDLSADPIHQLSEDTSPLILSSTAVISGSSETHLLQKSDADD